MANIEHTPNEGNQLTMTQSAQSASLEINQPVSNDATQCSIVDAVDYLLMLAVADGSNVEDSDFDDDEDILNPVENPTSAEMLESALVKPPTRAERFVAALRDPGARGTKELYARGANNLKIDMNVDVNLVGGGRGKRVRRPTKAFGEEDEGGEEEKELRPTKKRTAAKTGPFLIEPATDKAIGPVAAAATEPANPTEEVPSHISAATRKRKHDAKGAEGVPNKPEERKRARIFGPFVTPATTITRKSAKSTRTASKFRKPSSAAAISATISQAWMTAFAGRVTHTFAPPLSLDPYAPGQPLHGINTSNAGRPDYQNPYVVLDAQLDATTAAPLSAATYKPIDPPVVLQPAPASAQSTRTPARAPARSASAPRKCGRQSKAAVATLGSKPTGVIKNKAEKNPTRSAAMKAALIKRLAEGFSGRHDGAPLASTIVKHAKVAARMEVESEDEIMDEVMGTDHEIMDEVMGTDHEDDEKKMIDEVMKDVMATDNEDDKMDIVDESMDEVMGDADEY